jgi:predicted transcriptional regulator
MLSGEALHSSNSLRDLGWVSQLGAYASEKKKGETMRSDLIFGALTHVNNRYELCQLASKATRKLHKPNTRLQDTTNEVLDRFKDTIPMDESAEQVVVKVQLQERRAA